MTPIESDVKDYLQWMQIHNYAHTTIANRSRYLGYFICFLASQGIRSSSDVTLEDLLALQQQLFTHRKRNGLPLTVATQVQRLIPVTQFFSWLRRTGRLESNPAADMTMPVRIAVFPSDVECDRDGRNLEYSGGVQASGSTRPCRSGGLLFLWTSSQRAH